MTDSTSQYWFGLSEANPVTWFFEGVELPTTKLEDVDIVMPTFEKKALTHFQDCFAEVIRREDNIHVRIKIEGCAHSRQVYEPLLNLSKQ